MGIRVIWDNDEQTIIRYVIEGQWTWEDMRAAADTSNAMLDEAGHKVHFIYDMQHSAGVPQGALTNLRRFVGKEHPFTGQSVVVETSKSAAMQLARGLLSMTQRVYKADWKFVFASTLEEARARLAEGSATDADKRNIEPS